MVLTALLAAITPTSAREEKELRLTRAWEPSVLVSLRDVSETKAVAKKEIRGASGSLVATIDVRCSNALPSDGEGPSCQRLAFKVCKTDALCYRDEADGSDVSFGFGPSERTVLIATRRWGEFPLSVRILELDRGMTATSLGGMVASVFVNETGIGIVEGLWLRTDHLPRGYTYRFFARDSLALARKARPFDSPVFGQARMLPRGGLVWVIDLDASKDPSEDAAEDAPRCDFDVHAPVDYVPDYDATAVRCCAPKADIDRGVLVSSRLVGAPCKAMLRSLR